MTRTTHQLPPVRAVAAILVAIVGIALAASGIVALTQPHTITVVRTTRDVPAGTLLASDLIESTIVDPAAVDLDGLVSVEQAAAGLTAAFDLHTGDVLTLDSVFADRPLPPAVAPAASVIHERLAGWALIAAGLASCATSFMLRRPRRHRVAAVDQLLPDDAARDVVFVESLSRGYEITWSTRHPHATGPWTAADNGWLWRTDGDVPGLAHYFPELLRLGWRDDRFVALNLAAFTQVALNGERKMVEQFLPEQFRQQLVDEPTPGGRTDGRCDLCLGDITADVSLTVTPFAVVVEPFGITVERVGVDLDDVPLPPSPEPTLVLIESTPAGPRIQPRRIAPIEGVHQRIVVHVLGTPRLEARPRLARRELNLVVFLAHRGKPVSASTVQDALWGGRPVEPKTVWNLFAATRTNLGPFLDGTPLMPPTDRGAGTVAVDPRVITDLAIFNELVARAEHAEPEQACEFLGEALNLIDGQPFDAAGYDWAHRDQAVFEASMLIERAVGDVVTFATNDGALDLARLAIRQGLRGLPGNECIYRHRMSVERHAGNVAGVRDAFAELTNYLRDFDTTPSAATNDLYAELLHVPA